MKQRLAVSSAPPVKLSLPVTFPLLDAIVHHLPSDARRLRLVSPESERRPTSRPRSAFSVAAKSRERPYDCRCCHSARHRASNPPPRPMRSEPGHSTCPCARRCTECPFEALRPSCPKVHHPTAPLGASTATVHAILLRHLRFALARLGPDDRESQCRHCGCIPRHPSGAVGPARSRPRPMSWSTSLPSACATRSSDAPSAHASQVRAPPLLPCMCRRAVVDLLSVGCGVCGG